LDNGLAASGQAGEESTQEVEKKEKTQKELRHEEQLRELREATDKLEKANTRFKANQAKIEAERVDAMLDGDGEVKDPKKGKMTDKEYAEKVMSGDMS
jgi:hypothetical protein